MLSRVRFPTMNDTITAVKAVCLAARMISGCGGETYRAEETVRRMFNGFGYRRIEVLAFPTGITFTLLPDSGGSITRIVRIPTRSVNLKMLDDCNDVSRRVANGEMTPEEAYNALKAIENEKPMPAIVFALASGFSSAFFSLLFAGRLPDFAIAFLCGFLTQWILVLLRHHHVPGVISVMISSFFSALITLACHEFWPVIQVESVISGAIMPLVPGWALTNAIRDTIWGDLISGGAKTTEALLTAITLGAGIGIMFSVWGNLIG